MDVFRTIGQIRALEDLTDAEQELLRVCAKGEVAEIGDEVPDASDHDKRIRAGIIRYLMLGGCTDYRPHEKGVRVKGALIPNSLDLEGCACDRDLKLLSCRIEATLILRGARMVTVDLGGSQCNDIRGDRLKTTGGVFLRNGFRAEGVVRLLGAQVGGSLDCDDATFVNAGAYALVAGGATFKGDVLLRNGFRAEGEVQLMGSKISGSLSCSGGEFVNPDNRAFRADHIDIGGSLYASADEQAPEKRFHSIGEFRILNAKIGANFNCESGRFYNPEKVALRAAGAAIKGGLLIRRSTNITGKVSLSGASCNALCDDLECWPTTPGSLRLNGFTYSSFNDGKVDAASRLEWLSACDGEKQDRGFWPQPYEQLAKVFREMGHASDARTVLVEKERLQRKDFLARLDRKITEQRQDARRAEDQFQAAALDRALRWSQFIRWGAPKLNWVFFVTVGYGYRPFRSLGVLAGLVGFAFVLFLATWWSGAFAPNSPVVLISPEWESVVDAPNPGKAWEAGPGRDYETFNALAYAADIVVPIIDLGQETAWAPSTSRGWIGTFAWWARWR